MQLNKHPRVTLAHLPTPLEHLPRLSKHLRGPQIFVKRDDCTGLATGGNKTRKLEFSMGAALQAGADTVITVGAIQSNHVRQTAAAACKLGLQCEVLLEHRIGEPSDVYQTSGNVFLDRLFGANLREFPGGTDFDAAMQDLANELRADGRNPYLIPGGASNSVGALGYVECGVELLRQIDEQSLSVDCLVTASGSAGTHAGLAVGLRGSGSSIPIQGFGVNAPQEIQEERVFRLADSTATLVGEPDCVSRSDIVADCSYIGPGYGVPTPAMNEAIVMLARLEGLLFDPVYSGKALAGMIDYVREGHYGSDDTLIFLHTGGSAGLFAYSDTLDV